MSSGYEIAIPSSIVEAAARKTRIRPHLTADNKRYAENAHSPSALHFTPRFPLEPSTWRGLPVFSAMGILNSETAADFLLSAEAITLSSVSPFILDMSNVKTVDADGCGALIKLQCRAQDSGSKLYLLNCSEELRCALKASRLEMILPMIQIGRAHV